MGNRPSHRAKCYNEIVGYIGTVTDITERNLKRLEKSTKKMEAVIDAILI
jgi:hypothetical protein